MRYVFFIIGLAIFLSGCHASFSEINQFNFFSVAGKRIQVSWSGMPANAHDWIGLYQRNAGAWEYVAYIYTRDGNGNNIPAGTDYIDLPNNIFDMRNGNFELRYYLEGGYTPYGRSQPFFLGSGTIEFRENIQSQITVTPTPNESPFVRKSLWAVSLSNYQYQEGDWVGVFKPGEESYLPEKAYQNVWRVDDTFQLGPQCSVEPGPVEIRLFRQINTGSFEKIAVSDTMIINVTDADEIDLNISLATDKGSYITSESIEISWANAAAGVEKEVWVYPVGEPEFNCFKATIPAQVNGSYTASGSVFLDLSTSSFATGQYELKIVQDSKIKAVSAPFTISNEVPIMDVQMVGVE